MNLDSSDVSMTTTSYLTGIVSPREVQHSCVVLFPVTEKKLKTDHVDDVVKRQRRHCEKKSLFNTVLKGSPDLTVNCTGGLIQAVLQVLT